MVCSHCYTVSTNRLPFLCNGCNEVSFCSTECRYTFAAPAITRLAPGLCRSCLVRVGLRDKEMEQHAPYECSAFKRMTRTKVRPGTVGCC